MTPLARLGPRARIWTRRLLVAVEEWLPGLLLGIIAAVITADVIMRYIFSQPIGGASEVALACLIWLVYLACSAITRRGAHITLDALGDLLTARGKAIQDVLVESATLVIFITITVAAVQYLEQGTFAALPASGVSRAALTIAVPVGCTMMSIHTAIRVGAAVRGIFSTTPYSRQIDPIEAPEFEDVATQAIQKIQRGIEKGNATR